MASEVTVRGAGIFGLTMAWECVKAGARVTVVDPGGPGAGASGGVVGALAPHVPERWNAKKAFQLESLLAAEAFWAEVAAAGGGDPLYARTGRLQSLADAAAVARARERAAEAAARWQGAVWEVGAAPQDWGPVSATGLVVRDTLTARLHPARAVAALAAAIRARGGRLVAEAPDRGAVIWATGATGLQALSAALGREVGRAVKGQAALLALAVPDRPQILADGLHIVPHGDGSTAVGSTTERDFDDASETDARLDAVLERARAAVPALAGAPVLARWAGLRPRARSRAPLLGPWPGRPGHFVANGGFKIGFGVAIGVGRTMTDLVIHGRDRIPDDFRVAE